MSFDLVHIWSTMGPLGKAIAAVLLLMAVACAGVVVERVIALRRSAKRSRHFARKVAPLLEGWDLEGVIELAMQHRGSVLARLFHATTRRYLVSTTAGEGGLEPLEAARNEVDRYQEVLAADLRRGMPVLASVGSVAPFVGLLGTVVGIIAAFQGIAATGGGGLGAVSAGIAEALVETALGLMVAIPAVLAFNYLNTRVSRVELALRRAAGELLDELEDHHGRQSRDRIAKAA
jgi:biopolymer transport protein ExbB